MTDRDMTGIVFNITRFCVNDGPGIRTTVFFKGCPLHCLWCHNPESISLQPELAYEADRCISCGRCVDVCPQGCHEMSKTVHTFNRFACSACGLCADVCLSGALELIGRKMAVGGIIEEVLSDCQYYDISGGGLTLSGGEPLFQAAFANALLREAKRYGLHTCMETSGFASIQQIRQAAELVDLFLFDYKATGDADHNALTGQGQHRIIKNLHELDRLGAAVILRVPLIPRYNDNDHNAAGIAAISRLSCVQHVEVLPYHALGEAKTVRLGSNAPFKTEPPSNSVLTNWINKIQMQTDKLVKIG